MEVKEKIDILKYVHKNPNSLPLEIYNSLLNQSRTKKTTSTIFRFIQELVSIGYLNLYRPDQKRITLTRAGKQFLNSYRRLDFRIKNCHSTINIIIIPCRHCCSTIPYINYPYMPKENYGGKVH